MASQRAGPLPAVAPGAVPSNELSHKPVEVELQVGESGNVVGSSTTARPEQAVTPGGMNAPARRNSLHQ